MISALVPVDRRLDLPGEVTVIGIGGATLGGSGKTPLAIEVTRALAERARDVVMIGHAYRARPVHARIVRMEDRVDEVGDEALLAARSLGDLAEVVVAPTRSEALAFAARPGRTLVVDRLLQARPVRLARSLLAVDALAPWGSGRLFPFGDLLHPRHELLAAADEVVEIGGPDARRTFSGASWGTRRFSVRDLAALRVGLISTIARPERLTHMLAAEHIRPLLHHRGRDHAPIPERRRADLREAARRLSLDLFLADEKSAVQLPSTLAVPVATLDVRLALSPALVDRLANVRPRC